MTPATWSLAVVSQANDANLMNDSRSFRTGTNWEHNAMYPGSIHLAHIHADERRKDMLAEAQSHRRANLAVDANRTVSIASNLRHRIGVVLVAAGSRLQHPVADQPAKLGSLRAAR